MVNHVIIGRKTFSPLIFHVPAVSGALKPCKKQLEKIVKATKEINGPQCPKGAMYYDIQQGHTSAKSLLNRCRCIFEAQIGQSCTLEEKLV